MTTLNTLTLTFALLLPAAGCDLADAVDFDRSADAALDDRAEAPEHGRPHAPPPMMLVELAVQLGDLQDEPDMAEALAGMEASHDEARAAHEALRQALAGMAGDRSVSVGAVTTQLAAIEAAAAAEGTAVTVALDVAHDLLDAELRAEVVDMLPEPPPPPKTGAHPPTDQDRAGGPGHRPPPLHHLLHALELSEDQHEALRAGLGEPPAPEAHEPPDLASFADGEFVASTLGLRDFHAAWVTEHATRSVELLSVLVPLLDDDQLGTLVEFLQAEPEAPTRDAPV